MRKTYILSFLTCLSLVIPACDDNSSGSDSSPEIFTTVFQYGAQPYAGYDSVTDLYISSENPDTCYDAQNFVDTGFNATATFRTLILFDLSTIDPNDVDVVRACLSFRWLMYSGTPKIAAYRITEPWSSGATWNDCETATAWDTPGGDYDATPVSDEVTCADTSREITLELDPGLVKDWILNSMSNYGVLLKSTEEGTTNYGTVFTHSSAIPDVELRPRLTVYYTLP